MRVKAALARLEPPVFAHGVQQVLPDCLLEDLAPHGFLFLGPLLARGLWGQVRVVRQTPVSTCAELTLLAGRE